MIIDRWNRIPPNHKAAEKLSENKYFQKVILGVVTAPKKIADYLVPDKEIEDMMKPKLQIEYKPREKEEPKQPPSLEENQENK